MRPAIVRSICALLRGKNKMSRGGRGGAHSVSSAVAGEAVIETPGLVTEYCAVGWPVSHVVRWIRAVCRADAARNWTIIGK
jgi:hypothetical protein